MTKPAKIFHTAEPLFPGAISTQYVSFADKAEADKLRDILAADDNEWSYVVEAYNAERWAVACFDETGARLGYI
jgi:hypothetical protein